MKPHPFLALALSTALFLLAGSASADITAVITADNAYQIWLGSSSGVTTKVGEAENCLSASEIFSQPETFSNVDTTGADYLYLIAYDTEGGSQGLLAQITEGNRTLFSGDAPWEVFATGIDRDPCGAPGGPDEASIDAQIALAQWKGTGAPGPGILAVGEPNDSAAGTFPVVAGMSSQARWMWYSPGTTSAGAFNGTTLGEYLIFRVRLAALSLCQAPPPNMVAWWALDETSGSVAGETVASNDGTWQGGPTAVAGQVGGALQFDGVNDRVAVADNAALDFGSSPSGDFSVDLWVRTTDTGGVKILVEKRSGAAAPRGYSLYLVNGSLGFQLADGTGPGSCGTSPGVGCTNYGSGVSIADGNWHFVAVTVDRDAVDGGRWYVDGVEVGTRFNPTFRTGSLANSGPLHLGSRSPDFGGDGFLAGTLDEVELFGRALTPVEIRNLYNAGPAGKCKERVKVSWDRSFCAGTTTALADPQVCNDSTSAHLYAVSFNGIPASADPTHCTINGPTSFTVVPPTVLPLLVPARSCVPFQVSIGKPAGSTGGAIGCYRITASNLDTGATVQTTGSVWDHTIFCATPPRDPISLTSGFDQTIVWRVANTTNAARTLSYEIEVMGPTENPEDAIVSLDGREPGTPVLGQIAIPAGQSREIPVQVETTEAQPLRFDDILLLDRSNNSVLTSTVLRSVAPGCTPGPNRLCLNNGRFQVDVAWRDFGGNIGSGMAVPLTSDTGYFWFFNQANVELVIKVLDGRPLTGSWWIFYGALSNVEFTITVTDTVTGASKTYTNPLGQFASVGDTTGIPELGAADLPALPAETVGAIDREAFADTDSVVEALCAGGANTLCLNGSRFQIEVTWRDFQGNVGAGQAVPLTSDTGYFWFFNQANVELVIKVLDGRPVNGKWWVFYGALSNVEYQIRVTDTVTGSVKTYHNPSGTFASRGDTEALPGN